MDDAKPTIPINPDEVVGSTTTSKSFASNLLAAVVLPVIWPLIPTHIKTADWLPAFIGAVYLIVNAIFREMTRTRARNFVQRLVEDFDLPVQNPSSDKDSISKL